MSYADVWQHANDEAFQGRCRAALWDVSNRVAAGETGFPDAGQVHPDGIVVDVTYALKVLKNEDRLAADVLASQVLRNQVIAADPVNSADSDILYAINAERWADLREIN